MASKTILLIEDNLDEEDLTLRALKKNSITNDVVVAHDGAVDFTRFAEADGKLGLSWLLLNEAPPIRKEHSP